MSSTPATPSNVMIHRMQREYLAWQQSRHRVTLRESADGHANDASPDFRAGSQFRFGASGRTQDARLSRGMVDLPASAAWRHLDARIGFEVAFLHRQPDGYLLEGQSTAVEDGVPWAIRYVLRVDASWSTRSAHVIGLSELGTRETRLEPPRRVGGNRHTQRRDLVGCVTSTSRRPRSPTPSW